jgi:excisionase family DNA binding protein
MATAPKLGIVAPQGDLLERLRAVARDLPAEELPDLIGQLESVKAAAWARLSSPAAAQSQSHDELLSVEVAAERLGVSRDYLYRHAQDYPFTRRQGRKLLFSAHGIEKHIRQK